MILDGRLPGAGRMADYLLGDGHSLATDRRLAEELERVAPNIRTTVQLGRMFLRSAVTYLVRAGIRQFLKYGTDVSMVGGVQAIAQAADPECRVVYVDTDPISVNQGRISLAGNERAEVVQAELRDLDAVAEHPRAGRLLDLAQPIGLLVIDVLRFLPESWDPPAVLARCASRMVPGSHVAIAHLTTAEAAALTEVMSASTDPVRPRNRAEIADLFTGFELVVPGVTGVGPWLRERALTPAEQAAATRFDVGIGHKPMPGKRNL